MGYAVIGDLHGEAAQLEKLLDLVLPHSRRLVFLGDYVNRGPQSKEVLSILLDLQRDRPETVFVRGNHDWGFLEFLKSGDFYQFAALGGIPTIISYCGIVKGDVHAAFREAVPAAHVQFLMQLRSHFRSGHYLFSHTGDNPDQPETVLVPVVPEQDAQTPSQAGDSSCCVVCGHRPQAGSQPYLSEKLCCIDTGCGSAGGRLTCLYLPEMDYAQVDENLTIFSGSERPGPREKRE